MVWLADQSELCRNRMVLLSLPSVSEELLCGSLPGFVHQYPGDTIDLNAVGMFAMQ